MKYILLSLVSIIVIGCSLPTTPALDGYSITMDGRLVQDAAGLYHLTLDRTKYQTVWRVSGHLSNASRLDTANQPIRWESSHFWWYKPGDTLITIYRRNVDQRGRWIVFDTATVTAPDSLIVPTTNPTSYTDSRGDFSGMIAPTIDMVGDTMTIQCRWYSTWYASDTVFKWIKICLD